MRRAKRKCVWMVFGCAVISGWAWAEIDGSKHDFSNQEWTNGDVCSACHGPERSEPPPAAPLWDAEADLNRVFGTPLGADNDPGNGTLACLRCHDGTVAKDTVSQQPKERFSHKQNPALFQGGHQRSDHPVGVE
ncbi:MAG: hypothetical protein KJ749_10300, partial [Planctomycetes bacterium]|nr:hypothetical protein [Planctomycetota bacterium]